MFLLSMMPIASRSLFVGLHFTFYKLFTNYDVKNFTLIMKYKKKCLIYVPAL